MSTEFGSGLAKADDGYEAGKKAADKAQQQLDGYPDFAVVFTSPRYDYEAVIEGVREYSGDAKMIGSSSSGEFTDRESETGSVTVALISSDDMKFYTSIEGGVNDDVIDTVEEAAEGLPKEVSGYPHMAGINLHDGLAGVGESISLAAQQQFDGEIPFAGGSAGDDFNMEATPVFTRDRVEESGVALAVIASKKPIGVSVEHGHEPISDESFKVTEAEGNVVKKLDGRPAYDVWKEQIRDRVKERFDVDIDDVDPDDDIFAEIGAVHEFGIVTSEGNYKVRWPGLTSSTDGPMGFAVEMSEGVEVQVMDTDRERTVEATEKNIEEAAESVEADGYSGILAFDCVARGIVMGDDFGELGETTADIADASLAGFQTYGEVCMREGELSGYHNATGVIMLLPE
ncbi:MAG: FIST signal transduction protein [Candidatus Nanohaloarchaea archaeon]